MGLLFNTQNDHQNTPLLFFLGELAGETKHAICDPIANTLTVVNFPELISQLECLASAHGWLLLLSRESSSLFFFNPLTRQRIDLPYRRCFFNAAAFSAPPTSPSCEVFAVERDSFNGKFNIDILHVAKDKSWKRFAYRIGSSVFGHVIQLIYNKKRLSLYCVDLEGRISAFDLPKGKWEVLSKEKFKQVGSAFLVEFNGDILGVKKGKHGVIQKVFKVKFDDNGVAYWEEVEALNDLSPFTLFLSPFGGCGFSGFDDKKLPRKVFVVGGVNEAKCVKYEVDDGGEFKESEELYSEKYRWSHAPVWI